VRLVGLLLACVAFAPSGCAYAPVRYGGALADIQSVAVETLRNESYEAGVEYLVADALRREFLRRKAVRLVEDPGRADLVLSGSVLPIRSRGRAFSSVVAAIEYEVTLVLELEATRADGSQVPIDPRALSETERYLASADAEALRKNRQEALREAAAVLAGRVYDALYETLVQ
jgi:hypothetical protein